MSIERSGCHDSVTADALSLIGRREPLFVDDIKEHEQTLNAMVRRSRFLVVGAAGTIGQAVCREIFRRDPLALHAVDISENNLVELVRSIRSSSGYISGDFQTYSLDCGSELFATFLAAQDGYDVVLNLSALKHVRSEQNPYTLMRLIQTNVTNASRLAGLARDAGVSRFFCVSTDKAAEPANMMGASKRIMELFLSRESLTLPVVMARFANVAFSDGSLLYGFNQRFLQRQPLSAPNDVKRYFMTSQEAGELCLLASLLGASSEILFPKYSECWKSIRFSDIAQRYLLARGYEPHLCLSEEEARSEARSLIAKGRWPVYFFSTDTTGEKTEEQFYTDDEEVDLTRFLNVGVIKQKMTFDPRALDQFSSGLNRLLERRSWSKADLVALFEATLPNFNHLSKDRYLDERM